MADFDQEYEQTLTMLVSYAGDANAKVYDALNEYIAGNREKCEQYLKEADDELNTAHTYQYQLLSKEANGEDLRMSVLLIHAMDICMNAANSILYTRKLIEVFDAKSK